MDNIESAIPEVAYRHIKIECGKVSRRFHLNEDEREELESQITCETLVAVAKNYDPDRCKVYSFVQRVVHHRLCSWMEAETTRRNDLRCLAEQRARQAAKRELDAARGSEGSVDDTTYSDDERWNFGEDLPVSPEDADVAYDDAGLRRLAVIADVREVVAALKGDSKRLCKWYLKTESLRKTCLRMRLDSKRFFQQVWPQCRADFAAKGEELGKHFDGQA